MPKYLGALTIVLLLGMVLTRVFLLKRQGIQAMKFGSTDRTVLPQVRAGTIKAFAVTANRRLAVAPEIPTVDEVGLKGFYVSNWNALFAPKGTPKDIVDALNAAGRHALAIPSVRSRLGDLGLDIPSDNEQTPEALDALQKGEIEVWWPIIRAAGVKAE